MWKRGQRKVGSRNKEVCGENIAKGGDTYTWYMRCIYIIRSKEYKSDKKYMVLKVNKSN